MHRSMAARRSRRLLGALFVVAAAILLIGAPASAWSGRLQVSGDQFDALTFDNQESVVAGGDLHFLYTNDDGIVYRRTTMDVVPLTGEQVLKYTGTLGDPEGIAADGDFMALLYRACAGEPRTLEVRISHHDGDTWSSPVTIASFTSSFCMGNGSVAVAGQTVLVAWTDPRNGHINLRRSIDGGVTFGSILRLGTSTAMSLDNDGWDAQVHIAASGSSVIATWYAAQTGQYPRKLVLRRSTNGGASFLPVQTLDATTQASDGPSIAMAGQTVFVLHANKAGHVRVLRSVNGAKSFASKDVSGTHLTDDRPDIALDPANPSTVRAVWFSRGRIYVSRSNNGGATWAAPEDTHGRGPAAAVISPNVVVSGTRTVVSWNGPGVDIYGDPLNVIQARIDG